MIEFGAEGSKKLGSMSLSRPACRNVIPKKKRSGSSAYAGTRATAKDGGDLSNHPKVVQLLADMGAKIEIWNRPDKLGLTPLAIAEGYRGSGNFRPSPETVAALHRVMLAAGDFRSPLNVSS